MITCSTTWVKRVQDIGAGKIDDGLKLVKMDVLTTVCLGRTCATADANNHVRRQSDARWEIQSLTRCGDALAIRTTTRLRHQREKQREEKAK